MEILNSALFYKILLGAIYLYDYDTINPNLKPRDVPEDELRKEYDFVIVGGGILGCVIASRLSEIPEWDVLLMEAGTDEPPLSAVPMLYPKLWKTKVDWNFTTVPQKYACQNTNGICAIPRGKALGGTSVITSMVHVRGNRRDMAALSVPGLTYDTVLPYFIKTENIRRLNLPYSPYRGYNGPLIIQYPRYRTKLQDEDVIAGKQYGFSNLKKDYNGPVQEDTIAYPQLNIDGHRRQSAAKAYLYPVKDRKNLHIIKNSFAVKILIKNKKALGVQYIRNGNVYIVKASKEVIITAGAFNSGKLLMLSGIGPKKELKNLGIPLIKDLPVGRRLVDQPGVTVFFEINCNDTITTDKWKTNESIFQYAIKKRGPLSTTGMEIISFSGRENSTNPPAFQFSGTNLKWTFHKPQHKQIVSVQVTLINPKSVGTMTLQSSDPFDPPLIDPNYLSNEFDYKKLSSGIDLVFKYWLTAIMQSYLPKLFTYDQPKCAGLGERQFRNCVMRNYVESHMRPVGTTSVGPENSSYAVVNEERLVIGIRKLRVCGSSSLPIPLSGYTYAATYALAELDGDTIKAKHLPSRK